MPEALHRELTIRARKKFPGNRARQKKYTYGTLRKSAPPPVRAPGSRSRLRPPPPGSRQTPALKPPAGGIHTRQRRPVTISRTAPSRPKSRMRRKTLHKPPALGGRRGVGPQLERY